LEEKIFIAQQIPLDDNGEVPIDENVVKTLENLASMKPDTSINGLVQPVIRMRPGEIQRWRVIHAGILQTLNLQVKPRDGGDAVSLHEFAKDGIATGKLIAADSILLQPGYRSDILFQAPIAEGCREYVILDGYSSGGVSVQEEPEPAGTIAIVQVQGEPVAWKMPSSDEFKQFEAYGDIKDSDLVSEEQEVWFSSEGDRFMVNGKTFDDPDASTRRLILGQAQRWRVWAENGNHPFHIHVNPFEVIEHKENGEIDRYWKDTLLVNSDKYKTRESALEIRTRYTTFIGEFVLHCHNLIHEDRGMMQRVEIVLPGAEIAHQHE
jgi:FtsP/CotA-like multicopper oxidase with cupredoxin domain